MVSMKKLRIRGDDGLKGIGFTYFWSRKALRVEVKVGINAIKLL